MYCINCGVKLADTEDRCPLCGTEVFHPDLVRNEAKPLYPLRAEPPILFRSQTGQIILSTIILMTLMITLICDLQICGAVTWSGYVVGALLLFYVVFVLPYWFRKPNPVIFVPCSFAAVALYLLYINFAVDGNWFLRFAFPVTGYVGLLTTAVVVLVKYLQRENLYIFGGALLAFGIFMPVMELLLCVTFEKIRFLGWSWFPLIVLVLLGAMLIFLAISRPARETMERKFFL